MRIWLGLLFCLATPAAAQDVPAFDPVSPPVSPPVSIAPIALGATGPRMTVPVTIAGAGPYAFIIDTGAQRTVIARELASVLGLPAGRTVRVAAMTGSSEVGTVMIPSLRVSAIGQSSVEAPALRAQHLGAPGLLGIDALQGHKVQIDLDAQTMALTPSRRRASPPAAPDEIVVRAKSLFGQLVVTEAYCEGQRVRVILDTGSAVSMGNAALRRKIARGKTLSTPIALTSVTGGVLLADYTAIDRIRIGTLTIADLPIAFSAPDAAPFALFQLERKPAILLGMDALKLFRRVDIDFANREVRLALPRKG